MNYYLAETILSLHESPIENLCESIDDLYTLQDKEVAELKLLLLDLTQLRKRIHALTKILHNRHIEEARDYLDNHDHDEHSYMDCYDDDEGSYIEALNRPIEQPTVLKL